MPNEFKIRNGLVVEGGSTTITGSLIVTGGITGSLSGTFPFTGSAQITGSLDVIGPVNITGSLSVTGGITGSLRAPSGSQVRIDNTSDGNYIRIQNRSINFSRTNGSSEAVGIDGNSDNQLNIYARSGLTLRGGASAVNVMLINDEGGASGNASVLITGTSTGTNSGSLQVRNSANTQVFKTFDGGSVAVGTITTPTARLQVKGSGATASTTTLLVENSNATASLTVLDNGNFYAKALSTSNTNEGFLVKAPNNFDAIRVYDNGTVRLGSDGATTFGLEVYGNQGMAFRAGNGYINIPRYITPISANTGGSVSFGLVNQVFAGVNDNYNFFDGDSPATSVNTWNGVKIMPTLITQNNSSANMLVINPTYNLANSYTSAGIMRGLYYNPTITTLRTATHRAIETTSGDILFQSGSTPLFFVSQSGNVGIGTTTPVTALEVNGLVATTNQTPGSYRGITMGTAVTGQSNYINSGQGGGWKLHLGTSAGLYNASTVRMTVADGGIGIGTQSPTALLHISGASSTALFEVDSPALNNIIFVSGSGNVGIGTGTPSQKLDVYGNARIYGDGNHTYFRVASGASNRDSKILFLNDAERFNVGLAASSNTFSINSSNGGTPTSLNIDYTTGNVGIGITSPTQKLDVSGSIRVRSGFGYTSDFSGGVLGISILNVDGSDNVVIGSTYAPKNVILTSGIRYDFASTGLGINVTSPTARLQVQGSGATSSTTALRVQNSNLSSSLVVRDDGWVGIGTATPTTQLEVFSGSEGGTIKVSNSIYSSYWTQGNSFTTTLGFSNSGKILWNTNTMDFVGSGVTYRIENGAILTDSVSGSFLAGRLGTLGFQTYGSTTRYNAIGNVYTDNSTSGLALFYKSASVDIEGMRLTSIGRVGIGITTPLALLHNSGSSILSGPVAINSTNVSSGFSLLVNGTTQFGAISSLDDISLAANKALKSVGSITVDIDSDNNETDRFFRVTNNGQTNTLLHVLEDGNVGIGTGAPTSKLHVSGAGSTGLRVDGLSSVGLTVQAGNLAGGSGTVELFAGNNNNSYLRLASEFIREGGSGGLGINVARENITSKFQVRGSGATSSTTALRVENSNFSASLSVLDNGRVGINTGSAAYTLDVNGIARVGDSTTSGQLYVKGFPGAGQYIYLDDGSKVWSLIGGTNYTIQDSGTTRFVIREGGNVGIGTETPAFTLDVNGTARATTLLETSSERYKTNIIPLLSQLDTINKLNPVTFNWKDETKGKDTQYGLIAEEVFKTIPEVVELNENGTAEAISYTKLIPILIKSVQELQQQVNELKGQLKG